MNSMQCLYHVTPVIFRARPRISWVHHPLEYRSGLACPPTAYRMEIATAVICKPSDLQALFPIYTYAHDAVFGKFTISRTTSSNKGLEEVNVVLTDREIVDRPVSWMEPVLCKG